VKRSTWFAAALLGLVLYGALAFGIYAGLTRRAPGANDFYSRWMGARALLLQGQNPYADAVTRDIQLGMYGRVARPDEDQVAFAYPLYAAYLAAPLVALPYAAAQALWMALLVCGVAGGALALAAVNRIGLSPWGLALLLVGALFFYPSVRGIFLGQYALVSFACVAFAMLGLARTQDAAAGILLAIASVKPQPIVFLLPVILFWAWRNGRRRVVTSALAALAILFGSAFVMVPSWFADFLNALRAYSQYARVGPPLQTFFQLTLPENFANRAFLASSALLVLAMLFLVWRNAARTWLEFQFVLGPVALVTTLMAGRIGTPDQVLLLFLWMPLFAKWGAAKKRALVILGAAFLLVAPWWLFLQTLDGNREAIVVTTILPLSSLLVYAVSRGSEWRARSVT
jgi:hypothetical protein